MHTPLVVRTLARERVTSGYSDIMADMTRVFGKLCSAEIKRENILNRNSVPVNIIHIYLLLT